MEKGIVKMEKTGKYRNYTISSLDAKIAFLNTDKQS
jgi:hypothetical protein